MIVILIFLYLNAGEALYESLEDNGHKTLGKVIEFFVRGSVILALIFWMAGIRPAWIPELSPWAGVLGFVTVRMAMFNGVWNLVAGKEHTHLGTKDPYDRFLYWICYKSPIKPPPGIFIPVWEGASALIAVAILVTKTINL